MEIRTPRSRNWLSIAMLRSDFSSNTDSVISSSRCDAGSPDEAKALITVETRLPLENCRGDKLTETQILSGQWIASEHACLSAHSPSWMIRPISSATGMNSEGDTGPRSGWFHRIKASKEVTLWVCRL